MNQHKAYTGASKYENTSHSHYTHNSSCRYHHKRFRNGDRDRSSGSYHNRCTYRCWIRSFYHYEQDIPLIAHNSVSPRRPTKHAADRRNRAQFSLFACAQRWCHPERRSAGRLMPPLAARADARSFRSVRTSLPTPNFARYAALVPLGACQPADQPARTKLREKTCA